MSRCWTSENEGIDSRNKNGNSSPPRLCGQPVIKSTDGEPSGCSQLQIHRVVDRQTIGKPNGTLNKNTAAHDQRAESKQVGDSFEEMPAGESLVHKKPPSKRVGNLNQTQVGCP